MKYTVNVDANKRTVTVNYKGYTGVAKCCPTDTFNLTTGVELALERAKVAYKTANTKTAQPTVMELVRALEKALPRGDMVIIGNAPALTPDHKRYLAALAGVERNATEYEIKKAYDKGYREGYAKCEQEYEDIEEQCDEYIAALERVRELLNEVTE